MKKKNIVYVILLCLCFFLLYCVFLKQQNSQYFFEERSIKENFTPKIREYYNSTYRNIKNKSEIIKNKISLNQIIKILKDYNIY
jgi:hypothetical protein